MTSETKVGRFGRFSCGLGALGLILASFGAFAENYEWTGNGASSCWNDAKNWDGQNIPGGGDVAAFPTSLGDCSLSFSDQVVVGTGSLTIITPSDKTVSLVFNGGFSGGGNLDLQPGKGGITFSEVSTLSGDVTIGGDGGGLTVTTAGALGSGSGTINILKSSSPLILKCGMTIENPIHVKVATRNDTSVNNGHIRYIPSASPDALTFAGTITVDNGFIFSMDKGWGSGLGDQTVNFGPIVGSCNLACTYFFAGSKSSGSGLTYNFDGQINAPTALIRATSSDVVVNFNASENVYGTLYLNRSTYCFTKDYAFTGLYRDYENYASETVRFTGSTVHEFRGFQYDLDLKDDYYKSLFKVDGTGRVRLTARATGDQVSHQVFDGLFDFVWAPDGDYELQLPKKGYRVGANQAITGSLIASNGVLKLTQAFPALTALEGYNSGRIVLDYTTKYTDGEVKLTAVQTIKLADESSFACDNASGLPSLTELSVENGLFTCSVPNGLPKLSNLSIVGTGMVEIENSSLPENCALRLKSGCKFACPGTVEVRAVLRDGEELAPGYYTHDGRCGTEIIPELSADTVLYIGSYVPPVTPVESVWKGGGGDASLFNPKNWADERLPAFETGAAKLVFNGDAEVVLDQFCRISGFVVNAGRVTVGKASTGSFEVLPGSSTVAEDAVLTLEPDVSVTCGHAVAMSPGSRVLFEGSFCSENRQSAVFSAPVLDKSEQNPARVYFTKSSVAKCDFSFTNVFVTASGANPLGCGFGVVTICNECKDDNKSVQSLGSWINLCLDNSVVSNRFVIVHAEATHDWSIGALAGTVNEIAGFVDLTSAKSRYLLAQSGSELVLSGGLEYWKNNLYVTGEGMGSDKGRIVVRNNPIRLAESSNVNLNHPNSCEGFDITLQTSGNEICNLKLDHNNSRLTIAASNAVANTQLALMNRGTIDLNGHDTTFTGCGASTANASVTSSSSAQIVYTGETVSTNSYKLVGMAGFRQSGRGTACLMGEHSSGGVLGAAEDGTVVLAPTAIWRGDFALSERGRIVVETGALLGTRRASFVSSGVDWKLELSGDVTVKQFYRDGVAQSAGIYGPDDNIIGGRLIVRGDTGLVFIVR